MSPFVFTSLAYLHLINGSQAIAAFIAARSGFVWNTSLKA